MCNELSHGDAILEIDGTACRTKDDIPPLLKGSDLPGSTVVLTVKRVRRQATACLRFLRRGLICSPMQVGTGAKEKVCLVRMATEAIADRRKLFELFTALKMRALKDNDNRAAQTTDECIALWSNMVNLYLVHVCSRDIQL